MTAFTRREFISAVSGVVLAAPFVSAAQIVRPADSLKIKFFCPRWGAKDPWEAFCKRVKAAGYDGVETRLPHEKEMKAFLSAMEKYELDMILMALPGPSEFERHKEVYKQILSDCVAQKPLFINSHTGKDFFTYEQNQVLIEQAAEIADQSGVKIIHETHRGRFSFAAHITRQFLEKIPGLRLTLDASHWCNVAESLLENQKDTVNLAISRADHVHARVGFQEGPQVNDPRAPEWKKALQAHLEWWDQVVASHKSNGSDLLTITSEFGPPRYMPTEPYTRKPLSDQWEVNVHMMNILRERYL